MTISSVSTIYILISVGLCVDYSAHIAHVFLSSRGSSARRAQKALTRIGPSVFHAIASTFLAVAVLSASQSYVFRIFFKALALTVVLGGTNGLILLPALLSLLGGNADTDSVSPDSDDSSEDSTKDGDVEITSIAQA